MIDKSSFGARVPSFDEPALTALAIHGDLVATQILLTHHHAALVAYVKQRMPARLARRLSAEDLCQEVYIVVVRHLAEFEHRGPGSFFGWLCTIADRKLIDEIRATRAAKRGGDAAAVDGPAGAASSMVALLELLAVNPRTPSRSVVRHELVNRVRAAVERLEPEYQEVVRLRHLEGRSVEEVATALDRTPGAVRMLCHRALRRLAEDIGDPSAFLTRRGSE